MNWQTDARQLADALARREIRDTRVLERIATVPRHLFVPPSLQDEAYADIALNIGQGQTISQPYIVALMTEAAQVTPLSHVLEIGTGSGYQAAIIAGLCHDLISLERIPELSQTASARFAELGLTNITTEIDDGSQGWPVAAPFDVILVTAGAPSVPPSLVEQLGDGGRLVIPVGPEAAQELFVFRRDGERLTGQKLCDCRFVKLLGTEGWDVNSSSTEQAEPA